MKIIISYKSDGKIMSAYSARDTTTPATVSGEQSLELYVSDLPPPEIIKEYKNTHYVKDGVFEMYTQEQLDLKNNIPDGYIWVPRDCIYQDRRLLEEAKTQRWEAIKKLRSQKESGTFFHNNVEYDVDQVHIPGATQLALLSKASGEPFSINWTTASNSVVTLNADQMVALGTALASYISGLYDTARVLRDQINAAVTNADVDSINWP